MNLIKKHLILSFASLGFLLSLGAPLGFYVHDFYFGHHASASLFEHMFNLHRDHYSTILYIGLGTNIFFTFFGAMTGMMSERILFHEHQNEMLKKSKHNIIAHILTRMRRATTIGLEGLSYLNAGMLTEAEKSFIINETIKELKQIDESAQDLLLLKSEEEILECCSVTEVQEYIEKSSSKYKIAYDFKFNGDKEQLQILTRSRYLCLAFDLIFEWASLQEMNSIIVVCKNHQMKMEIRFTLEHIDESFNIHLLKEVIENNQGFCLVTDGYIQILLPHYKTSTLVSAA